MVQQPLGLVEVGRDSCPVLVVSLEPDRPLAGALAGQQFGRPGGPDVGVFASLGQGLFTGSGLVSVLFSPVYFGVRRAHKGRLSSNPGCDNAVVRFAAALDRWICFLAVFGRMMLFVVPHYSKGRRSKKRRPGGRGRLVISPHGAGQLVSD